MHKFLIVRLGALGDVVHAIPVAAALRARFPSARIDWMVDPRYVELLRLVPAVDGAIEVNLRTRWGQLVSTVRDLRRMRYDAAIDAQGLIKSAVLARAVRADRTIGFPPAHLREPAARLFYSDMPDPAGAVHVVRKNLALLAPLGVRGADPVFPLSSAPTDDGDPPLRPEPYALMTPGAGWPNKAWPADRFGALAALLRERHELRTVVLWGPGEVSRASEVVAASGGAATLAPATRLPQLVALARGARVMIGGDTGPVHLAAAAGTPVVALFGPSRPERNGPWDPADEVVSRAGGCACLYQRRCRTGAPCLEEVAVEEVLAAVGRRLRSGDTRSGLGRRT